MSPQMFIFERRRRIEKAGESRPGCPKCGSMDTARGPKGRYMICRGCSSSFKTEAQKERAKTEASVNRLKLKTFSDMQRKEAESNRLRREFKDRQRG